MLPLNTLGCPFGKGKEDKLWVGQVVLGSLGGEWSNPSFLSCANPRSSAKSTLHVLHAAVSAMEAGCGRLGVTLPVPSAACPPSAVLVACLKDAHQGLRALWGICMSWYGHLLGVDHEATSLTAMKYKESQGATIIAVGERQYRSI